MDASRIFVKKDDSFKISLMFTKTGDLKVARDEPDLEGGQDEWERFEIEFAMPDFGLSKLIMRNSVSREGNAEAFNAGMFHDALLSTLAKRWNLCDPEGKESPLDLSKLNELRPDIVQAFVDLLCEHLIKIGVYQSIIRS
jgi:hypothetical protein